MAGSIEGLTAKINILIFAVFLASLVSARSEELSLSSNVIKLPGGADGIGFDDLRFSRRLNKVLVPGGQTGKLFLIDPSTNSVTTVKGLSSDQFFRGGHGEGMTSVDEGEDFLFAIDRSVRRVMTIAQDSLKIVDSSPLAGEPDYVRYVKDQKEVWVTEPDREQIEVFSCSPGHHPILEHRMFISVPGGPESLVIDNSRQRAYTHLWASTTVAIDLKAHTVTDRWPNNCQGSRGIALDEERGFLFVGCAEGKAVVLDVSHGGRILGTAPSAEGIDSISYDPRPAHLYLPGSRSAIMKILKISKEGDPILLGEMKTTTDAHCVTSDDGGDIWVCDPPHGQLLLFKDFLIDEVFINQEVGKWKEQQ